MQDNGSIVHQMALKSPNKLTSENEWSLSPINRVNFISVIAIQQLQVYIIKPIFIFQKLILIGFLM